MPPRDEDPDDRDIERFSDDLAWCPSCSAKVWDDAYACPACGEVIEGRTMHRPPESAAFQRKLTIVTVVVLLIAALWCVL